MKNQMVSSLISGIILFIWGFLSWAIFPWHNLVANQFTNESSVSITLKNNAPKSGIYYLPFEQENLEPGTTAAFVNVLPNGFNQGMGEMMTISIVGQVLSAFLVSILIRFANIPQYWNRVRFITFLGLLVGFISHFPYWNWFGFSSNYVLVIVVDSTISWFLASLILAKPYSPPQIDQS
jgi:hypothetical protein